MQVALSSCVADTSVSLSPSRKKRFVLRTKNGQRNGGRRHCGNLCACGSAGMPER
jgi:hypothetical protein